MPDFLPARRRRALPPDAVLSREVQASQRPGINAAVRVQGAAFVASVAMNQAAMLSKSADQAFRSSPMGEDVYRGILGAYGQVVIMEITNLALRQDEVR